MFTRFSVALLACAITGAPAIAQTHNDVAIQVDAQDLNLATSEGRDRLNSRVNSAARKICRSGMRGLAAVDIENRCIQVALADAQSQVEAAIANSIGNVRVATSTTKTED
jgi:UrcA family protein